jgi:hypothetical protein
MSTFDTDFATASGTLRELFWLSVTFQPAGGGSSRSIQVSFDDADRRLDREDYREDEAEELWVGALFNVDDADYGGIADRELQTANDVARIVGPSDSSDELWGFAGEVRNRTTNDRQLKFTRQGPRKYGGTG